MVQLLLSTAVDDAIRRGDTDIERIAIRAASPLTPAEPAWTEVRDLPPLFYAVYDVGAASPADARRRQHRPGPSLDVAVLQRTDGGSRLAP